MVEIRIPTLTHEYSVHLGRGQQAALSAALERHPSPRLLLSDSNLAACQQCFLDELDEDLEIQRLILPPGESTKSTANLLVVLGEMRRLGMERGSPLAAFGGGVVGDLGGLAASLWKRGVPFLQCPTSLLAMVDASVGGKTAVNFGGQKNAVGSFWPPVAVFADLDLLSTLPVEERVCGFGELLKAAWLSDAHWAEELENDRRKLLDLDPEPVERHVERAIRFKRKVVIEDEREVGPRALLNLGHSFAHALESQSAGLLKHGQAVLLGMRAAAACSGSSGFAPAEVVEEMCGRLDATLAALGLRVPESCREVQALMGWMNTDKKVSGGRLRLVLPIRVGEARICELDQVEPVHRAWNSLLENHG